MMKNSVDSNKVDKAVVIRYLKSLPAPYIVCKGNKQACRADN